MPKYITCFDEHLIKLLEEKEIAQSSRKADDNAASRQGATTRSQQQPHSPEHYDNTVIEVNAATPEQGIEHHANHRPAIRGVDEHSLLDAGPHHSMTLAFNLESRKVTTDSMPMSYYSMISEIKNNMDTDLRDDESLNSTAMALINGVSSNSHGIRESPQSKEVAHPPTAHMNSVLSLQPPPPGHKRIDNLVLDTHATVQRLLRKLLTIRSLNSWTRN